MGLFLLIQTIPGANDILVDRDDITVRFAWFYKRHWSFSQIDHATADHNGLHVFVKGRKRRAFVAMAPLSVGTARDFWRARPGSYPGLALPTIFGPTCLPRYCPWHTCPAGGVEPPEGDGFCRDAGQGGRFRARFRLPCASSRRPFPARAAGPPEGDGRRRGTPQGGFSERRPRLPCGGLQQICRSPQGFTRRPRPALPRHPSVFPRA